MTEEIYSIKFPKTDAIFMNDELTFSINHIKSRELSTLYFIFTCYDRSNTLIHTYTSNRWIITPVYSHREATFKLPMNVVDDTVSYQIELIGSGLSSENPLYFNEVMLQEGEFTSYHVPMETETSYEVKFNKNSYANLYNTDEAYLQVIRPQKDKFLTNVLTKSSCSVLAPHLWNEENTDDPITVFLEFVNQSEQRIDVLR